MNLKTNLSLSSRFLWLDFDLLERYSGKVFESSSKYSFIVIVFLSCKQFSWPFFSLSSSMDDSCTVLFIFISFKWFIGFSPLVSEIVDYPISFLRNKPERIRRRQKLLIPTVPTAFTVRMHLFYPWLRFHASWNGLLTNWINRLFCHAPLQESLVFQALDDQISFVQYIEQSSIEMECGGLATGYPPTKSAIYLLEKLLM